MLQQSLNSEFLTITTDSYNIKKTNLISKYATTPFPDSYNV